MSTAAPQTDGRARRHRTMSYELQVPRNEQVASMLIAMVIFVTVLAAALFVVWLTYQLFRPVQTVPMSIPPRAKGGAADAHGNNDDLEPPGAEVVPELSQPTLEDTRQRLMDAVGRVNAEFDNPDLQGNNVSGGQGLGGRGNDEGLGDGGTEDAIPRHLRWKINFLGTAQVYARQLDDFKIELAVARGSRDEIVYAKGFSRALPTTPTGPRADEKRARFEWENGTLRESDRQLLIKAGITIGPGDRWMQYYEEDELIKMERVEEAAYLAKGWTLVDVWRTVFKVHKVGARYEFYVDDIRERPEAR